MKFSICIAVKHCSYSALEKQTTLNLSPDRNGIPLFPRNWERGDKVESRHAPGKKKTFYAPKKSNSNPNRETESNHLSYPR